MNFKTWLLKEEANPKIILNAFANYMNKGEEIHVPTMIQAFVMWPNAEQILNKYKINVPFNQLLNSVYPNITPLASQTADILNNKMTDEEKAELVNFINKHVSNIMRDLIAYSYDIEPISKTPIFKYMSAHNIKVPDNVKTIGNLKLFASIVRSSVPTWYFKSPHEYHYKEKSSVKNSWIIHFTDHPDQIAKNGFTKGRTQFAAIGLTVVGKIADNVSGDLNFGGLNFGFFVNPNEKFTYSSLSQKYGRGAVLFQSLATNFFHEGDGEEQAVFYGPSVNPNNIILLEFNDNDKNYMDEFWGKAIWNVKSKKDNSNLYSGTLSECIQWAIKNENIATAGTTKQIDQPKEKSTYALTGGLGLNPKQSAELQTQAQQDFWTK